MRWFRTILLIICVVAVIAGAAWGWYTRRTVDGRTATQWLAFAHQASQHVPYAASGVTTWRGTPAAFSLNQGDQGRYQMRVMNDEGQLCVLGDDGEYTWYTAGGKTTRTASAPPAPTPSAARCRILGTGTVAGRRSVRLRVFSGDLRKDISIDRKTGVTLTMTTADQRGDVSRMRVKRISYRPVAVTPCPPQAKTAMRAISRQDSAALLGVQPVEPGWLPSGMTARGLFREQCACCGDEMVVLRYSDGVRAMTFFEMSGDHLCVMGEGCQMAPTSGELIDSRRVGTVTVIAVGNVDHNTLTKVMQRLR